MHGLKTALFKRSTTARSNLTPDRVGQGLEAGLDEQRGLAARRQRRAARPLHPADEALGVPAVAVVVRAMPPAAHAVRAALDRAVVRLGHGRDVAARPR